MPNIWEPPNKQALPTPRETKLVEENIELLETQLQSTTAVLVWAQHAIATLQRHIDERRAWIAPVRRLNRDILSDIFLDICEEGPWWAPLDLARVCQVWRHSVLAMPRAWSYFSMRTVKSPELVSLYFTRSAPCPLHISLPTELDDRMISLLASVTERIQCLHMRAHQYFALQKHPFPMLERLHILGRVGEGNEITNTSFLFDSDVFPSLRSHGSLTTLDTIPWRMPPFTNFVLLQELRVVPKVSDVWSAIVKHCAKSLKSLTVNLSWIEGQSPVSDLETVQFPKLEHLSIYYWSQALPIPWTIDAKTPILQTYKEDSLCEGYSRPLHKDTATVVSLYFVGDIEFFFFPSICQMEPHPLGILDGISKLCDDPGACPNLEVIVDEELGHLGEVMQAREMIAARNALTGRNIRFGPKLQYGVFSYPEIQTYCRDRMACSI